MRVCTRISDGRILEAQSGGGEPHLETLLTNARNAGYADHQVAVTLMADADFYALLAAQVAADAPAPPDPTKAELLARIDDLLARVNALAD